MATDDITCSKCILSTNNVKEISFDEHGVCNYCNYYDEVNKSLGTAEDRKRYIDNKVKEMKASGRGKKYHCILGVSGGTDSSYLAYWSKQQGLRPLVVHFDNGWNSELAVKNIQSICDKLGFELYSLIIDWEEFKQLQLAYLKAGVIDIEVLTDHAIMATIYKIARKQKIHYTLSGFNYATEAVMPKGWTHEKKDFRNIKDINQQYGKSPIRQFPHVNFLKKFYIRYFTKFESIPVLNYIDYNKEKAKEILINELGWRDYGGKHYESTFTKFYQAYILPEKFGVDKRLAHLSNLICSGQMTKEQAYKALQEPLYQPNELKADKEYVAKKFDLSVEEFDQLMASPPRSHFDFKTEGDLWNVYFRLIKKIKFWKK